MELRNTVLSRKSVRCLKTAIVTHTHVYLKLYVIHTYTTVSWGNIHVAASVAHNIALLKDCDPDILK